MRRVAAWGAWSDHLRCVGRVAAWGAWGGSLGYTGWQPGVHGVAARLGLLVCERVSAQLHVYRDGAALGRVAGGRAQELDFLEELQVVGLQGSSVGAGLGRGLGR